MRWISCLSAALALFLSWSAVAETVHIDGPLGPLAGELVAVAGARHVVVIIPGSGPTDRDGNSVLAGLRSDTYRMLAAGLQAAGVSSLRIDKRGLYGSAAAIADPNDVTVAAYAEDLRQWIRRAAEAAPCVWLAGHSEGGLVALAAARQAPESLCGLILLASAGRPVGQLLLEQLRANPANGTLLPEAEAMVAALEAGRYRDPATLPPALQPLFPTPVLAYLHDLFAYDPSALAQQWRGPALVVQGDADVQVKMQDALLLSAAMPQARRVDLAGATHMLKQAVPGQPLATYTDPALPLHPDLLPALLRFLAAGATPLP